MKKCTWIVIMSCLTLFGFSQTTSTFEELIIPDAGFLNGSDGSGGFENGNVFLPNQYDQTYAFWSGWSISNSTDTMTPGFGNQYSSISGAGNDSENYAVAFAGSETIIELRGEAQGNPVQGLYVNNSTYAYLSMRDGDAFAKKFGGIDGTDPDYFLLTIKKYSNGVLSQDSIDFFLADYRFAEASSDYIIEEWTYVDLTSLGSADSLAFSLSSTDVGQFGMNTPSYFCIDDITTADGPSSLEQINEIEEIELYPNPTFDYISYKSDDFQTQDYEILDMTGRIVRSGKLSGDEFVDISSLNKGQYVFQFNALRNTAKGLIIKL